MQFSFSLRLWPLFSSCQKSANLPAGMKIAKIFEIDASPRNITHRLKKILLPFKVVPEHVQIFINFSNFMLCKKMVSSNFL
jgi:hypothetical protein